MNPLINTKELCKKIKTSKMVIWSREDKQHFITNRHFLVRFDELPRDVLVAMFSVFCKTAKVGQTLSMQFGKELVNDKSINAKGVYKPDLQTIEGEQTVFLRVMDKKSKRYASVIKFTDRVEYLDCEYTALVNEGSLIKSSPGFNQPIYMANDDLLILPFRVQADNTFINELLEIGVSE
jgi:hypothetical protein